MQNEIKIRTEPAACLRSIFSSLLAVTALTVAGIVAGLLAGTLPPLLTGLCFAGAAALLLTVFRTDLALYLYFSGVVIMTDTAPGSGDFFYIPDMDILKGLPSGLTTFFLLILCVTAARRIYIERRPFPVPLRGLAVYLVILSAALLTGLFRNGDRDILRVDFMNMLFPVLCFYLCLTLLCDYERICRMLTVLLAASALQSVFLSVAYLAGKGWIYQLDDAEPYRITTMDSSDLLFFITLLLIALYLLLRRDIRGIRAVLAGAACIPMLFAVIFSYRRAQWVGLVLSMGLLFAGAANPVRRRIIIALLMLLCAGSSLVVIAGMSGDKLARISERMASVFDSKQSSNFYHLKESQQVFRDICKSPLTGLGLGSHHSPLGLYEEDVVPTNVVHNTFLYIWMKMGLPGLIFFIWAAWVYARRILRVRREHPQAEGQQVLLPLAASSGLWFTMFLTSPVPWYFHQTGVIALFAAMGMSLVLQAEHGPGTAAEGLS